MESYLVPPTYLHDVLWDNLLFVVFFLLGDSPASEFYIRRFGTLGQFHLHRWCEQDDGTRVLGYLYGQMFGSKLPNLYLYKCPNSLVPVILPAYTTYEDETDSFPKRRHIKFGHRESPKRKNTAFRTRRTFEIKNLLFTVNNDSMSASYDQLSCVACGRSRTRLPWLSVGDSVWLKDGVIYKYYITPKLGKGNRSEWYLWNYTERGKTDVVGERTDPVPLCASQMPHWLSSGRIFWLMFLLVFIRSSRSILRQYHQC